MEQDAGLPERLSDGMAGRGLVLKHQEMRLVRPAGAKLCGTFMPCQGIWTFSRGNWALEELKAGQ